MRFEYVFFLVLRVSTMSVRASNVARTCVNQVAALLESSLATRLSTTIPLKRLPEDITDDLRKTWRGDDKAHLYYNRWLGKHTGFNTSAEGDLLFKDALALVSTLCLLLDKTVLQLCLGRLLCLRCQV